MPEERSVSATRVIPADPRALFDVVADPRMHPLLDGSGTVRGTLGPQPERLALGARFGMLMRIGLPYPIRNRVVEFEEGRRIGWAHAFRHVWRFEFEPVEGGTRVTETFDYGAGLPTSLYYRMFGFIERARDAMPRTLERLEQLVHGEPVD